MTERGRELLPPEEATSWDEFQDRWVIERARYQGTGRTWRETGRLWLSVLPGLAAVVFWVAFALSGHGGRGSARRCSAGPSAGCCYGAGGGPASGVTWTGCATSGTTGPNVATCPGP